MRIAVDGGCFGGKDERLQLGIYRFASNFLPELSKQDRENKYFIYSFYKLKKKLSAKLGNNFSNIVVKPKKGFLKFWLPLSFLVKRYDCYLGLSQALPWFHPFRSIVFIHDLAYEVYPECFIDCYDKISAQTKKAALESDKIIVFSSQTVSDLKRLYNINEGKIKIIKQGVDLQFRLVEPEVSFRVVKKYNLPEKFFLYVGAFKKIKNIPFLIKGFCHFAKRNKKKYRLVLCGSDYWLDDDIGRVIKKEKAERIVINLGYLPDNDLVGLYNRAAGFVSASLYEGFGQPVLEAASCGCLPIVSDILTHRENLKQDGIYFDLDKKEDLSGVLEKVANMSMKEKEERSKALVARAGKFKWSNFVEKLLKVFNESCNSTR